MNNNFRLIQKDINYQIFLDELEIFLAHGGKWALKRAKDISVQKHTKNILIRNLVLDEKKLAHLSLDKRIRIAGDVEHHELSLKTYPYFQKTYSFLEDFTDTIGGQLTRVVVVSLAPRSQVYAHIDNGKYYEIRDRYHIPIKTSGSLNRCGTEYQVYKNGELWWFDNKKIHEAFNESDEERIHIIFDVLPRPRNLLRKLRDWMEKEISLTAFKKNK